MTHPLFYHSTFLINFGTDKQKQLTVNKVDYFVPLYFDNVFDKPNEQNEACFNSAMARKRRQQANANAAIERGQSDACIDSAEREQRRPKANCCPITLQLLPNHRPSIAQSLTNRATVAMQLGNTCSTRRKWPHLHTHCRVCLELTRTLLVTAI